MTIDRVVFAFSGVMVLLSLGLAHFHHPYWLWFTALVGDQLASGVVHRLLSTGKGSQDARCAPGPSVQLNSAQRG